MPELRKDPVVGRWVIISTERSRRPTNFLAATKAKNPDFCPFCPGNEDKTPPAVFATRPDGGSFDAAGWSVRVVPNKFPALRVEGELDRQADGIFDRMNGVGAHEVVIETPEHMHTLATMPEKRIEDGLYAVRDRLVDLKRDMRLKYALVFKNHGVAAGATQEHPHSQIIALPIIPRSIVEELKGAREYFQLKDRCIYCDIVRQEAKDGERVVMENDKIGRASCRERV